MSFDTSRYTFDPWNNFAGVVMPQGRVQLDSDWNEWLAELGRRIRAGTLDIVGRAAVPITTKNGFKIELVQNPNTGTSFSIGQGRMYVDGLLAENHGSPAPDPQKWIPANTKPGAYTELPGWDSALDEFVGTEPVDYYQQPYFPGAAPFPQSGGPYLIYLDVWQREVTFLEHPDLIEKAVGVDTAGRLQTVWQVKWLDVSNVPDINCLTHDWQIPAWANLLLPSGARLTTGVVQSSSSGPCCLNPNDGYTGLENQHYRVEIHGKDQSGTPTFKWSRDNASVATGVTAIQKEDGKVLTVQSTGKDDVLRFSANDWVEITDDWLELCGLPGELHQIAWVSDQTKSIRLATAVSLTKFPVDSTGQTDPTRNTRIIRWDQGGKIYKSDGTFWVDLGAPGSGGDIPVPPEGKTLILENGITVSFHLTSSTATFKTGDFWTFAARATDGTIEYLDQAPPRGIYHHYARLAVVSPSSALGSPPLGSPPSNLVTLEDCRTFWPPAATTGGSCDCPIVVNPSDFDDSHTLQQLLDQYHYLSTETVVCFSPGTYSLKAPLLLTVANSNLTLKACQKGTVVLQAEIGKENQFINGLIVLANTKNVTLEGLTFSSPLVAFTSTNSQFAGLPIGSFGPYVQSQLNKLTVSIGVRPINCSSLTIENCLFEVSDPRTLYVNNPNAGADIFGAGIFAGGQCDDLRLVGNNFQGGIWFGAGYLHSPAVAFNPPSPILFSKRFAATRTSLQTSQPASVTGAKTLSPTMTPGAITITSFPPPDSFSSAGGGEVLPSLLNRATIRDNSFSNLSAAVLIIGEGGLLDFASNRVENSLRGLWVVAPGGEHDLWSDPPANTILVGSSLALGYPLPENIAGVPIAPLPDPVRVYTGTQPHPGSSGIWMPDISVANGGTLHYSQNTIGGGVTTADQALYQNERTGSNFTYTFTNLSTGFYSVALKFAEIDGLTAGQRAFNVLINNAQMLTNFDIFGDIKLPNTPDDQTLVDIPTVNNQIVIQFVGVTGDAKVSAIELDPQWATPGSTYPGGSGDARINEYWNLFMNLFSLGHQAFASLAVLPLQLRITENEMHGLGSIAVLVLGDDRLQNGKVSSLTMTGNRLNSASSGFLQGEGVTIFDTVVSITAVLRCVISGNQILNTVKRYSLYLSNVSTLKPGVVVMSNLFQGYLAIGPPRSQTDPTVPAPLNTWDYLNTVIY